MNNMPASKKDLLQLENKYRPSPLERLLASESATKSSSSGPKTTPIPQSNVLGKVKDFLVVMDEANRKLQNDIQEKGNNEHDIENIAGEDGQYIEMDLALGVADLYTPEALAAAEAAVAGQKTHILDTSSDSDQSDSDNDSYEIPSETDDCSDEEENKEKKIDSIEENGKSNENEQKKSSGKRKPILHKKNPKRPKIEIL